MKLRMGTRGSALALAQSGWAVGELKKAVPGLEVETVVIKTSGDKALGGPKGLFVKEIEEALSRGRIDFAIHSAKDLPGDLAPGLFVAAYPPREDARDVFIGRGISWNDARLGARIGTSALRRKVQLLMARPGLEILPLRGNVDTRLRRLERGDFDGLVLAAAGLRRLGRQDVVHEIIPADVIVPAPGQGALAIEVKEGRQDVAGIVAALDDERTRRTVELERAFLKELGGDCSTPLGAFAEIEASGLRLTVFWSREDGGEARRLSDVCPNEANIQNWAAGFAGGFASQR